MSLHTYKEGEHPTGFIGCRVVVGSKQDENIFSKYVAFDTSWIRTKSKARMLEAQALDEYGFIKGKARRCFSHKTNHVVGDPDLVTPIRCMTLTQIKKKCYLKSGGTVYRPYMGIKLNMYSQAEHDWISISRTCSDYKSFCHKWNEMVDLAVKHYKLDRAKKGWRQVPVSEATFERILTNLQNDCRVLSDTKK